MTTIYAKFDDTNVDEINTYWSSNVKYLKNYFYDTPGVAYALHFGLLGYLNKLFVQIASEEIDVNFINEFQNTFMATSWNQHTASDLHEMLRSHETRSKNYNAEKAVSFFEQYYSRTEEQVKEDSSYAIFPGSKDQFLDIFLIRLYPSLRNAFVSYLEQKQAIVFQNKKDKFVRIKNYKFKLEELNQHINCFSSQVLLQKAKDGLFTFKEFNQFMSIFINNVTIDIDYLKRSVDDLHLYVDLLENKLETQKQEGINGYLLTWH